MEPDNHFYVVQCRDETLRSYTRRFNKEMLEVTNCHDSMAIQAFINGLINGTQFYDSLAIKTPMKMVDVLSRASEFMKLEDDQRNDKISLGIQGEKCQQ